MPRHFPNYLNNSRCGFFLCLGFFVFVFVFNDCDGPRAYLHNMAAMLPVRFAGTAHTPRLQESVSGCHSNLIHLDIVNPGLKQTSQGLGITQSGRSSGFLCDAPGRKSSSRIRKQVAPMMAVCSSAVRGGPAWEWTEKEVHSTHKGESWENFSERESEPWLNYRPTLDLRLDCLVTCLN